MIPLEANLRALSALQPGTAAALASSSGPFRAEWSAARTGAWTAQRSGLQLASRFDPAAEARKAVPDWADDTVFGLAVGLGLGYGADALAERFPGLPLVIAEADPLWAREVLEHRDLSALWATGRVFLVLGPEASAVGAFLADWEAPVLGLTLWRPGETLSPGWSQAVRAEAEAVQLRGQANRATGRKFFGLWARNFRRNQAELPGCSPLASLKGGAAGRPVVIAAAGPSLADQLDWLKTHRSRFVLLAVDTAWNSLAAAGLVPDLLVVLDGQYWNARHVDLDPPATVGVVTEAVGPGRAFRLAPGRTFVAATSVPLLRLTEESRWGRLGDLPSGGSVATAAWSLARLLGAGTVVFAGLDLGYPKGQTHVPGSQFEESVHRRSGRLVPAETLGRRLLPSQVAWRPAAGGGIVLSDPKMDLFRNWLTEAVAASPGWQVFNLGVRGSLLPGVPPLPAGTAEAWAPVRWSLPEAAPLGPSGPSPALGWEALEALAASPRSAEALNRAWGEFSAGWGPAAEKWAGRAHRTWVRFPGPGSRDSLAELLLLVLELKACTESL